MSDTKDLTGLVAQVQGLMNGYLKLLDEKVALEAELATRREDIRRFELEFLDYVGREQAGIMDTIRETKDLSDDSVNGLQSALDEFKRGFVTTEGDLLIKDEPVEALPDEEIEHSKITRQVRR